MTIVQSDTSVAGLLDTLVRAVDAVSNGFDRWDESHVSGPGLYFVVIDGPIEQYTDPMGDNCWPVEECPTVDDDFETVVETAEDVGFECDGAVVVTTEGTIREQMVRMNDLNGDDRTTLEDRDIEYGNWMGARHMSAIDVSTRASVVAAITLSEETGRVSIFVDGVPQRLNSGD